MSANLRSRWTRFDQLFAQLVNTLDERENLKRDHQAWETLVDGTDRLHSIRANLATVRCELTTDNPLHPCTKA